MHGSGGKIQVTLPWALRTYIPSWDSSLHLPDSRSAFSRLGPDCVCRTTPFAAQLFAWLTQTGHVLFSRNSLSIRGRSWNNGVMGNPFGRIMKPMSPFSEQCFQIQYPSFKLELKVFPTECNGSVFKSHLVLLTGCAILGRSPNLSEPIDHR